MEERFGRDYSEYKHKVPMSYRPHAHGTGHTAFKNSGHEISMRVTTTTVITGIDQLYVDNVIGKRFETRKEVAANCEASKEERMV